LTIPQLENESPQFSWQNQNWEWLPNRSLWHADSASLFLSDFHLGKAEAFQRAGINLPQEKSHQQINSFFNVVQEKKIKEVFILGDLLHGPITPETSHFLSQLQAIGHVRFYWIIGNHDARSAQTFGQQIPNLKPFLQQTWNGILLCHEPDEARTQPYICGHIHPGIRLPLGAKQSLRAPCAMLSENYLVLPAFGRLTGLHIQKPLTTIKYFVFSANQVLKFSFKQA
jgi:DNA ligase-associated metallophosphoesterase